MEMKGNVVVAVVSIILLTCMGLAWWYPHVMISPGNLLAAHQHLTTDCFSCHTLFRGTPAEKCMTCHKVEDIGLFDTTGKIIEKEGDIRISFHQELINKDCVACHSDHQGIKVYRTIQHFSHELLVPRLRKYCNDCHLNPGDNLHKVLTGSCSLCHNIDKWAPATFNHELLDSDIRKNCHTCHINPRDSLHEKITGNCDECHGEDTWTPATFSHDQYFELDRDHDVKCIKCHINNNYSLYSCYECHEHRPAKIRSEHIEENIHDFENCTECHRNADEDDAERIYRSNKTRDILISHDYEHDYDDDDFEHQHKDEEKDDD
jgi:hypothetical protein